MDNLPPLSSMLLWGLLGTLAMTTVLQGAQQLGWTRLSLPTIAGTWFSGTRRTAAAAGFVVYVLGGWAFALLYYLLFASVGITNWWFGALVGLAHGVVLLVAVLPVVPHLHPRMASDYAAIAEEPRLEPPGFMALNYGPRTPLCTLAGQFAFGAVLGGLPQLAT